MANRQEKTPNTKNSQRKLTLFKKGVRIGMGFYIVEIFVDNKYFINFFLLINLVTSKSF